MDRLSQVCGAVLLAFSLLGCTSLHQIRTDDSMAGTLKEIDIGDMAQFRCDTGRPAEGQPRKIVEDYGQSWIGYAEYDDQGWARSGGKQVQQVMTRLDGELGNPKYAAFDFQVIVFIHGWHHNAYDNDCNVQQFRSMIKRADDQYSRSSLDIPRRVVGIYVGWRGESVDFPGLRYLTVLDRRNSAEHVAKGEVRALFATLRKFEIASNGIDKADPRRRNRFRSTVIGHSFGGLIAFHGLSQAVLSELAQQKPGKDFACGSDTDATAPQVDHTWPDLLVLINPAFEASRFEPLHNLMRPVPGCPYNPLLRPKVLVFTADNDWATGVIFTGLRRILSVFESYSPDQDGAMAVLEKTSNLHAIGFVDRYRTHRVCRLDDAGAQKTVVAFTPPAGARADEVQDHRAPVWVIGAPADIIDGHDGFLYAHAVPGSPPEPLLLNWIIGLHTTKPNQGLAPDTDLIAADGACGGWQN